MYYYGVTMEMDSYRLKVGVTKVHHTHCSYVLPPLPNTILGSYLTLIITRVIS